MITVTFGPHSIAAVGHADTAPAGQDLVCAAVSTLFYALHMGLEAIGGVDVEISRLRPGEGHIEAHNTTREADGMFTMVKTALSGLAESFPDAIQIK